MVELTGPVPDRSSPSAFSNVMGGGRFFEASVDCTAGGPSFSLDEREGGLIVVLGFGFGSEVAFASDFASGSFTGVSRKVDFWG
jgi:hypothetical protein